MNTPLKMLLVLLCTITLVLFTRITGVAQSPFPFQNPDLPTEDRISNILSLMTLDEKIASLDPASSGVPRLKSLPTANLRSVWISKTRVIGPVMKWCSCMCNILIPKCPDRSGNYAASSASRCSPVKPRRYSYFCRRMIWLIGMKRNIGL